MPLEGGAPGAPASTAAVLGPPSRPRRRRLTQRGGPPQHRRGCLWTTAAAAAAAAACAAALKAARAPGTGSAARAFLEEGRSPLSERLARILPSSGAAWRLCAPVEGASCPCVGTAALHTWTGDWAMVRHTNGSIPCTPDAFGDDPRPHFAKFCSCLPGPRWPAQVADGLNATIARKLVPRVEVGPAGAGCDPVDDGLWTPCAIMSVRFDASVVPDRYLPMLPPQEQQDAALRRLDMCHHLAGAGQALRVLGVWPTKAARATSVPMKVTSAPVCAVVYDPSLGAAWEGRAAVFCPTDPPRCLEESCECADKAFLRKNVQEAEGGPECWACVAPEEQQPEAETQAKGAPPQRPEWSPTAAVRQRVSSWFTGASSRPPQAGPGAAAGERR